MIREVLTLLWDTFRPRCVICGRRRWSGSSDVACRYRPKSYGDDALRKDGA